MLTKEKVLDFLARQKRVCAYYGVSKTQFWELVGIFGHERANAIGQYIMIMGVKFYITLADLNFDKEGV
jgi:hypothetical protein